MRCLVQPEDGIKALVDGIDRAKETIEILIFRFDIADIEKALANAVKRGVCVRALVAYTNRGGERRLRALEMRLLAAGVNVARSADDLVRYHGKMMIVDRRELYLLAFNFTHLDLHHSRSFGVITEDRRLVQEALKLFEADATRQPYTPESPSFVVSPVNAREQLGSFLSEAARELLIYDPEVSDPAMVRMINERAKSGVAVRVIGWISPKCVGVDVRKLASPRLHTRTIVRDGSAAFVGSQSLRALELDRRREIGLIVKDPVVIKRLLETFQQDWEAKQAPPEKPVEEEFVPAAKVAKKVAKQLAKDFPPVTPALEAAVEDEAKGRDLKLDPEAIEETVREVVKKVVKEVVMDHVEETIAQERPEKKG